MKVYKEIYNKIKERQEELGMSTYELGKRSGISPNSIYNTLSILEEKGTVTVEKVGRILKVLDIKFIWNK